MSGAVIEENHGIAVLRLQNAVANPIGPGLVSALEASAAVDSLCRAMVLAGGPSHLQPTQRGKT